MTAVKHVQSVQNACLVFETVAGRQPIGVSEIARETGLDKSGVHRIAITLHQAGWIQPTASAPARWQLSSRIPMFMREVSLAQVLERASGTVRRLRDECGETALLVASQAGRLVVIDVAHSDAVVAGIHRIGDKMPMFGATGAAWFAAMPEEALGQSAFVDSDEVDLRLVQTARDVGYSVWEDKDVVSIGAAVLDAGNAPMAVLVVIVPVFRGTESITEEYGQLIRSAAEELSGM